VILLPVATTQLSLQVCPIRVGLFVEVGSHLPRLALNLDLPNPLLPSILDHRCAPPCLVWGILDKL
jgi:hypothetical protein